ncbi:ribose-phosphate pyrophosphokinase, partial [Planctomyces bekefii]
MDADLILFSGNSNRPLANGICEWLDMPLGQATVSHFADGETRVELLNNVRGRDVFILQPISRPVNHHLMEALLMADACRRSSAARVTLVAPYFGYARQERKSAPRTPISAKLVADLIETAGFNRMLTMELHTAAIQGFFNIPVDHLYAKPIFSSYFKASDDMLVVSPDAGGVERARAMAKHFNCGLAIVDKRRDKPNDSAVMNIIGDVKGKQCLMVDDIVDTAGSMTKAADALLAAGALSVRAAVSHAVLSSPAIENLNRSNLKELVVTDSIQLQPDAKGCKTITQLSIAELLGKA